MSDATEEPGEPPHYDAHTVWYRFRPVRTERITIDFAVAGYDCALWLYRGRELAGLDLVRTEGSGDFPPMPTRLTVRRGVLYHLALGCAVMADGRFVLNLRDGTINDNGIDVDVLPPLTLRSLRKEGLRLTVRSKRPTHVRIELRVRRGVARRLGLASQVLGR